jgi:hypothetical protein
MFIVKINSWLCFTHFVKAFKAKLKAFLSQKKCFKSLSVSLTACILITLLAEITFT